MCFAEALCVALLQTAWEPSGYEWYSERGPGDCKTDLTGKK